MNLQQRFLTNLVMQEIEHHLLEIPEDFSVEENIERNIRRLSDEDFLVLEIQDGCLKKISMLAHFADASTLSEESKLFTYQELEAKFHEQQSVSWQF